MTKASEVTEPRFYKTDEVMKLLGCCRSKAQSIIREINKKQEAKGKMTLRGKVSAKALAEVF